jgi:hypothetical protein
MRIHYSVTGEERKDLVTEICRITGDTSEYQFMPTCSYKIGDVTVEKDGTVACEDKEKLMRIKDELEMVDFTPEEPESEEAETLESAGLTVEIPLNKANTENLDNLLTSKGKLIRHALGVDALGFEVKDDRIAFSWFKETPDADEAKAYTDFIAKLCALSNELKRSSSRELPVTNEKYSFRCFLLRLGFIGPEYKEERKILLKNLSGSSSWKNGAPERGKKDEPAVKEAACE